MMQIQIRMTSWFTLAKYIVCISITQIFRMHTLYTGYLRTSQTQVQTVNFHHSELLIFSPITLHSSESDSDDHCHLQRSFVSFICPSSSTAILHQPRLYSVSLTSYSSVSATLHQLQQHFITFSKTPSAGRGGSTQAHQSAYK